MPELVMVTRAVRPEIDTDTVGVVRLALDDGEEIVAERGALLEALGVHAEAA